ncbi:MAG: DUF4411 family protein [Candidatus Kapabacteria bacterium]|nr:DUF4411 family protein [Candidatus Kapabacteria bacterium]
MKTKYCLDTNFFVQGWNKYYSPIFCSGYWEIIDEFGKEGIIFIPEMVKKEINKVDDTLKEWLKNKEYLIKDIDSNVQRHLKEIYAYNESHIRLVDNTKNRSQADPWVIAHAMSEHATVVTKEEKIATPNSTKIKIPNVCENMGVRCIDDFEFIKEVKLLFQCRKA